jgi:hypothetical protein
VQNERFDVVSSLSGLPAGVRNELQMLFGSRRLDIADPGAAFQAAAETVLEAADAAARGGGVLARGFAWSTTNAAAAPARGAWRYSTGGRTGRNWSGEASRQAA